MSIQKAKLLTSRLAQIESQGDTNLLKGDLLIEYNSINKYLIEHEYAELGIPKLKGLLFLGNNAEELNITYKNSING